MSKTKKIKRLQKQVEYWKRQFELANTLDIPRFHKVLPNLPMKIYQPTSHDQWFYSILDFISDSRGVFEYEATGDGEYMVLMSPDILGALHHHPVACHYRGYLYRDQEKCQWNILGLPIEELHSKRGYLQLVRVK